MSKPLLVPDFSESERVGDQPAVPALQYFDPAAKSTAEAFRLGDLPSFDDLVSFAITITTNNIYL